MGLAHAILPAHCATCRHTVTDERKPYASTASGPSSLCVSFVLLPKYGMAVRSLLLKNSLRPVVSQTLLRSVLPGCTYLVPPSLFQYLVPQTSSWSLSVFRSRSVLSQGFFYQCVLFSIAQWCNGAGARSSLPGEGFARILEVGMGGGVASR